MKQLFKPRYTLDLQLFAGEQSVEVDGETFEIDPSEQDEQPEITHTDDGSIQIGDDDADDSFVEDEEEEAEPSVTAEVKPQQEEKDENPTAKAVIAERNKWKAKLEEANKANPLVQKLLKMSGLNSLEELQMRLDAAEAQRIAQQSGITPQQAQLQLQQQRDMEDTRKQLRDLKYDSEVQRLKADPFFADIDHYREEFQEIADRTGQTLEKVYWSERGPERMKEREREIEQAMTANRTKKQAAKVDTSVSAGSKPKVKHGLSADELAIAKLAGMSPEEYAKNKKK